MTVSNNMDTESFAKVWSRSQNDWSPHKNLLETFGNFYKKRKSVKRHAVVREHSSIILGRY
jgi:hypothetical protein